MRGGRILWGQIIVVFTIVLVMVWTSTQWVAFRLGFQPQLGNPWFDVAGWPVYYPPAFFWWWFSFDAYAPGIFTEGAFIATSGALFAIAAAFFMIGSQSGSVMSVTSTSPGWIRFISLMS